VLKDCVRARGDCWGERERGKGKAVAGGERGGERRGGRWWMEGKRRGQGRYVFIQRSETAVPMNANHYQEARLIGRSNK